MNIENKNSFIVKTAKDYDMSISIVERYYNIYGNTEAFYQALEEEIKV